MFENARQALGYDIGDFLRHTDLPESHLGDPDDLSSVSEWLALEKAKRLDAQYVFFRRFEDRPSQPLFYVYDYTENMSVPSEEDLVLLCQIRNSFYIGQYPLVVAHVFFGLRLIFRFAC